MKLAGEQWGKGVVVKPWLLWVDETGEIRVEDVAISGDKCNRYVCGGGVLRSLEQGGKYVWVPIGGEDLQHTVARKRGWAGDGGRTGGWSRRRRAKYGN